MNSGLLRNEELYNGDTAILLSKEFEYI